MPRAKKSKRLDARIYKNYDSERMQKAIEDCRNGGSYLSVAKRYGINRTTLMNHVKYAETLTSAEIVERLRLENEKKQAKKGKENKKIKGNETENKKRKGNKKGTKRKTIEESSSSDSNVSVTLESEDDISESGLVTAENEISSNDEMETNDVESVIDADNEPNNGGLNSERLEEKLKKGSWVLAKYRNASYVGKVLDIKENKAETMFLRKNGLYFVYPHVPDQEFIQFETIQQILEEPHIQRGKHYFKIFDIESGTIIN